MQPFVEKLILGEPNSFYVGTHNTPFFEVQWHQHSEIELILFKEGFGTAFIGNYVGEFKKGDIFLIGPDLPHTFQKAGKDLFVSAIVVQFRDDLWGNMFMSLPECKQLKKLFEVSSQGLKMTAELNSTLYYLVNHLQDCSSFLRIIRLAECLQMIEERKEYEMLSPCELREINFHNKKRIDDVHRYTVERYFEPITLEKVASVAAMTVPAFCAYFKKSTRKTYIEFLTDIRISNACKLLVETDDCINDICYSCGFNTLTNFNRQFHKVKQVTPSLYRKMFRDIAVML